MHVAILAGALLVTGAPAPCALILARVTKRRPR